MDSKHAGKNLLKNLLNNLEKRNMEQKNNTAVAVQSTEQNRVTQQLLMDYLKQTNSGLLANEQAQFLAIAQTFNLNPWKREVYAVAYGQGQGRKLSIIVGYEVYLRRAEEFPQYDGYETEFFGEGPNLGCTCKVYRKDRTRPTGATVFLKEYTQNNKMWNEKTHVMLEKVAIATAMRRAFPSEFNGMPYIADELPDNMTGADRLNQQGYTEIPQEHEDVPKKKAQSKKELTADEKSENFRKMMDELKAKNEKVLSQVMEKLEYESYDDVPEESRKDVYCKVLDAVKNAEKEVANG